MQVFAELPSLKFVKCASLIGHNNNQDMRTRQMQETISKFRDGRVCYYFLVYYGFSACIALFGLYVTHDLLDY